MDACLLDKIGRIVCMVANETHQQKQQMILLREMLSSFLELYKSVHPGEALQLEKLEKLRVEMRECCPPEEKPDLICDYKPCDRQGRINLGDGHSVKSRAFVDPVRVGERPHQILANRTSHPERSRILPKVPQGPIAGS